MILNDFIREFKAVNSAIDEKEQNGLLGIIYLFEKLMNYSKINLTHKFKLFLEKKKKALNEPLNLLLSGKNELHKIHFINLLANSPIVPPYDYIIDKKFTIFYSQNTYTKANFKHLKMGIDPYSLNKDSNLLDDIDSFEVFVANDFFKNYLIIKDNSNLKNIDLVIRLIDCLNDLEESKRDVLKEIPTCIVIEKKNNSTTKKYEDLNIFEFNINDAIYESEMDKKIIFSQELYKLQSSFENKDLTILKNTLENLALLGTQNRNINEQVNLKILEKIKKQIHEMSFDSRNRREKIILNEILEEVQLISHHYDSLFLHYKKIHSIYNKESSSLIKKILLLELEYKQNMNDVLEDIEEYLNAILDVILENTESIKLRLNLRNSSFIEGFFKNNSIIKTQKINVDFVLKELNHNQSFLNRKYKILLNRIHIFNDIVDEDISKIVNTLTLKLNEWVTSGHYFSLLKHPNIIATDDFFDLEEFNLIIDKQFSKGYKDILNEFADSFKISLNEIFVWVKNTKKILLKYILMYSEEKIRKERLRTKKRIYLGKIGEAKPIDKKLMENIITDILPDSINEIFKNRLQITYSKSFEKALNSLQNTHKVLIRAKLMDVLESKKIIKNKINKAKRSKYFI